MIRERGVWVNGKAVSPKQESVEVGWILVVGQNGNPVCRTNVFRVINVGDTLTIEYRIEKETP